MVLFWYGLRQKMTAHDIAKVRQPRCSSQKSKSKYGQRENYPMKDGIYNVCLTGSSASTDTVLVLSGSTLNGGGTEYLCQGRIVETQGVLTGSLTIIKRDPASTPLLGRFKTVLLLLTGNNDPQNRTFQLQARGGGHTMINIDIEGRYLAPLM